jgi:hypothetical protein
MSGGAVSSVAFLLTGPMKARQVSACWSGCSMNFIRSTMMSISFCGTPLGIAQ